MSKISAEDKIYYCKQYLEGKLSQGQIVYDTCLCSILVGISMSNMIK